MTVHDGVIHREEKEAGVLPGWASTWMLQAATVRSRHRSVLAETCMVEGERELASEGIGRLWVGLSLSALLAALPQPFIVVKSGGRSQAGSLVPRG